MRGGAALVGDATTVSLLERWTRPGGRRPPAGGGVRGRGGRPPGRHGRRRVPGACASGLIECCYVETGARGVGVGHGADGGRGGLVHRAGMRRRRRAGPPGGPLDQAAPRGGRVHGPAADAQPPVGLNRRSVFTRRGGGGGIAARAAWPAPAPNRRRCGPPAWPPRRRGCPTGFTVRRTGDATTASSSRIHSSGARSAVMASPAAAASLHGQLGRAAGAGLGRADGGLDAPAAPARR